MNVTTGTAVMIRPGLLDRLKDASGIRSDDAFARTIGITRQTLSRLRAGDEPNLRTVVGIAQAFDLAFGEVVQVVSVSAAEKVA